MQTMFFWRVTYANGQYFDEIDPDKWCDKEHDGDHAFACINQERLIKLSWLNTQKELWASVPIKDGYRPILFRRFIITDALGNYGKPKKSVIHVIGFQQTENSINRKWLLAILPDHQIVMVDDDKDLNP